MMLIFVKKRIWRKNPMQSSVSSQPKVNRWAGWSILLLALAYLFLALVSIVSSFLWPQYTAPFSLIEGVLLFLPLLGHVVVGIVLLRTSQLSLLWMLRSSSLAGLALGGVLGVVIMLPGQDLGSCPGFVVVLLALAGPGNLVSWISGIDIWRQFQVQAAVGIPLTLLGLLVYGGIAWWGAQRTGRLAFGFTSALLAAFLTPVTISLVASLIHYTPLLWPPHQTTAMCFYGEGVGKPIFKYYYSFLMTTLYPLVSQLVFALVAGLLGALLGRWRSVVAHSGPLSS
jgi:hypothetical protein